MVLNGLLSYTFMRQNKELQEENATETGIKQWRMVQNGWDKLHNISVTGMYKLNEKMGFSFFSLQKQPVTLGHPNGQYQYQGITVSNIRTKK